MSDENRVDPYGGWSDELTQGELRRLMLHLDEATERLQKAYGILDDAGLIEAWDETPGVDGMLGDYGFIYDVTSALSYSTDGYMESSKTYQERRGGD